MWLNCVSSNRRQVCRGLMVVAAAPLTACRLWTVLLEGIRPTGSTAEPVGVETHAAMGAGLLPTQHRLQLVRLELRHRADHSGQGLERINQ